MFKGISRGLSAVFLFISAITSAQINSDFQFGKGIKFSAENSDFELVMKSRFQTLYTASTSLGDDFGDFESGILVRRSRLKFDGKATDRLKFKMEFGLSNRDFSSEIPESGNQANMILDAVLKYKLTDNLNLWFGQTKLPGNRERVISSQTLQLVDRSLLNRYFTLDRDIGFQLRSSHVLGENFVINEMLAVSQGEGRNITAGNFGGYNYTFRAEFLPFGNFSSKGDYLASSVNFVKGEENEDDGKLSIAVTYDINDRTARSRGQLGSFILDSVNNYQLADINTFFIDAMYKYKRFSYMGEYAWRESKAENAEFQEEFISGSSFNNQVGMMISSKSEISFRHTHVDANTTNIIDMFTLGFSRYVSKHNLKFQTDLSLTNQTDKDQALLFRFQTEVAF